MNIRRVALIIVAGIITASCSEKSAPDRKKDVNTAEASREAVREPGSENAEREGKLQPDEDQIAEDCVTFVRSTKVVPAGTVSTDCPGCPARGTDVLSFHHMKTDAVSCSGDTCTVVVTIFSVFNPGLGETITGGLTAWIPPEQRSAYLSGQTPSGEQAYRVQITYKRRGAAWRAVEFDRAPGLSRTGGWVLLFISWHSIYIRDGSGFRFHYRNDAYRGRLHDSRGRNTGSRDERD